MLLLIVFTVQERPQLQKLQCYPFESLIFFNVTFDTNLSV